MRPEPLGVGLDVEVAGRLDARCRTTGRSSAGTGVPTRRRALVASGLLDRLARRRRSVGRGRAAHPQADAERRLAPAGVAVLQGLAADRLAGADQRRGPLELLDGQQAQRVPHQHGHARRSPTRPATVPCSRRMAMRVGGEPQVRLGLAAAGGEEEQVGERLGASPVGVRRVVERDAAG